MCRLLHFLLFIQIVISGIMVSLQEHTAPLMSYQYVLLSWVPLTDDADNFVLVYEVGYNPIFNHEGCIENNLTNFSHGYTSYINTSDVRTKVFGLEPGTCYVFGVRITKYCSTATIKPGNWRTTVQQTLNNNG